MPSPLPRDFAATGPAAPTLVTAKDARAIVDVFDLQGSGLTPLTRYVVVDAAGNLGLLGSDVRAELAPALLESLTAHLIRARTREIEATQLYLMAAESLELGADRPGPDDPVRLRGVLHGPFPASAPVAVPGQLTMTLPELLSGLVRAAPHATHQERFGERRARACFHALVPADETDAVRAGSGVVLVYPTPAANDGLLEGNEELVAEWLQSLIETLRADLSARDQRSDWLTTPLPVATRAAVEASLRDQGYEIRSNEAVRPRRGLAGLFLRDAVDLPRVAGATEFLTLADRALSSLPAGPGERARAAAARCRSWEVNWTADAPFGLAPVPLPDGVFRLKEGVLRSAWGTNDAAYVYFRLAEQLVPDGGDLELEVEFQGSYGLFGCQHSTIGGEDYAQSVTPAVSLDHPPGWRVFCFRLEHADLRAAQNGGADFRLWVCNGEFQLRRVTLRTSPARIAAAEIETSEGHAFLYRGKGATLCPADLLNVPPRSRLCLREDGRPLGPPHRAHTDIAAKGGGQYSHWSGTDANAPVLYFSSSDGSDPRTNGRAYALLVRR